MKAVVHCSKVRRMAEAELKVGGRVVILSEGKDVADGRLEALDGVPANVTCEGLPCIRGTCVVAGILTRSPECDETPLPLLSAN